MKLSRLLPLGGALLVLGGAPSASAQAEPYLGQLIVVGYTFCPRGWVSAEGQLMSISENNALYALYGTTYGGDGVNTFGMPDLRGRAAIHVGTGPGLPPAVEGEMLGAPWATLTVQHLPQHDHTLMASTAAPSVPSPNGNMIPYNPSGANVYATGPGNLTAMVPTTPAGSSLPVDQYQPSEVIRYCIATEGIFPPHN